LVVSFWSLIYCNFQLFLTAIVCDQLLLGYAGPASNVRVEHVSRDCFKDGSALAEVMSLYENIDKDNLAADHHDPDTVLAERKSDRIAIKVRC